MRLTTRSAFKDDPSKSEPQTKIDALVREHTGYSSLKQMCKSNPTLRAPPGASPKTKKDFAQLRKAFKRVTGKAASK